RKDYSSHDHSYLLKKQRPYYAAARASALSGLRLSLPVSLPHGKPVFFCNSPTKNICPQTPAFGKVSL
ncbi:MAG TPA: hypothetical protein PLV20_05330, partial [Anaerolineaceae bacterium]|nr:hypothetical protein [Anaerolineaceae bacterium]